MHKDFKEGLIEGIRKSMYLAEATAKKRMGKAGELNVRTGHLRRSITSRVEDKGDAVVGSIGSAIVYSRINELGGTIRPKVQKYLKFQIDGHWVSKKKVTIPARPYLKPSIEENFDKIRKIIIESITRKVNNG